MAALDSAHPSPGALIAYARGQLSSADLSAVEVHIAGCETCCQYADQVPEDSFAAQWRPDSPTSDPYASLNAVEAAAWDTPPLQPAEVRQVAIDAPTPEPSRTLNPQATALPPAAVPPLPAGLVNHPRYRIVELLGKGGMGVVYLAEHREMKRKVALKVISNNLLEHPTSVERFRRETRVAASLDHPNIVRAFDAEQVGDTHFLVLEYVVGTSVADFVKERGRLAPALASSIIRQAALGLQHAHEQGMVHRDIKPGNLLITGKGKVKVLDFGLARFASDGVQGEALTQSGCPMGTPDYIPPEQVHDARSADIRSDIYSLGCTFYHLLTGQPPFAGRSQVEKIIMHSSRAIQPLRELAPEVSPELAAIVHRMMDKDPTGRFQTPLEVAKALEPFIREELRRRSAKPIPSSSPLRAISSTPASKSQPVQTPPVNRRPVRFSRIVLTAAVAMGLLCSVTIATVYTIRTSKGTLVVDTGDHDVKVIVKQDGVVVHDKTTKREFDLSAGEGEIEVYERASGLKLATKRFVLTRNGRVTVSVTQEVAQAKASSRGEDGSKPPAPADPDRRAAEWVLRRGGWVVVRLDSGRESEIRGGATDLPRGGFELVSVFFHKTNLIDDDLIQLKGLKNLRRLSLWHTGIGDAGLAHIQELKGLTWLELATKNVTNGGMVYISELKNLKLLDIQFCPVGDEGLVHLKDLKYLERLELSDTLITDAGLIYLKELKNLAWLRVAGTKVSGTGLVHLKDLKDLYSLGLGGMQVTDTSVLHIKELKNLTCVDLNCLALSDAGLIHLKELRKLTRLHLTNTPATDTTLVHFKELSNLTLLDLSGTKVTASGVRDLRKQLPQCKIIWAE